jgi:hypothetical protein
VKSIKSIKSIMTLAVAATLLAGAAAQSVQADTFTAANKVGVSASDLQVINSTETASANPLSPVTLMSTTFKTSTTEDLIIQVNAETGLYTAVGAKGSYDPLTSTTAINTSSTATGQVIVWVELDGQPLPVTTQNPYAGVAGVTDDIYGYMNGPIVFNSRAFNLSTQNLTLGQQIALFIKTRSANSFQWFATNVGNGDHTVVVKANLVTDTAQTVGGSTDFTYTTPAASAMIGQRTLNVEPLHLMNSASY